MTDLGIIKKNSREEIRITAENFRGHDLINIRVWFDDGSGTMRPGKHGIAFKVAVLPEFAAAIQRALDGAKNRGAPQ
ncbi:MAG: transcriptional coactivator p15/PC4 family protein [Paracoccus aminovorans]|nr:transcriptional coactivator p15/PC4 family protein [Paracoccus aminovorans]